MLLSLNSQADVGILEMAKSAKQLGADVTLTTQEESGAPDVVRTITIVYHTHAPSARTLRKD